MEKRERNAEKRRRQKKNDAKLKREKERKENKMREEIVKEQICDIGRRMYQRNMVAANDGNISVRISEHEILCTPTGVSKGFMTPEYICKTDENGKLL